MSSSSPRQPWTPNVWACYKREYRTRFCRGRGSKIAVEPGQNILKLIQDGFESCANDLTITSSSPARCSTPIVSNDNTTTRSTEGLTNSVERASNSSVSLPASPEKAVNNRAGWSHESPLKPVICDCVADSKTPESPASKEKTNDTLKDVEALRKSPDMSLDPEDDHEPIRLLLLEEAKGPPAHTLHPYGQNTPDAVKSCMEVENLGGPQTGRDEQVVLMNGAECIATSSVQKRKSFSSVVLAAVATETLGKRYSASVSPPSPPPVKDQDKENECDFVIDESYVSFNSFFSIPCTNKKSRKASSATPVSKFQPSEKMTEGKKSKNRKAQVEALTKQKMDDLDIGIHQLKGTSESHSISDSEGKVLKSQRQNITHMEKEKTEGKKGKKRRVQVEARTKQKMDDLDVRMHELEGTSESDSICDSEGKVLKSQRQNITCMEKEKTKGEKSKKRKVQVEARTKQKMDDLDARMHELEGTSESDSICDSEGKVLKSQRRNITHKGKTKKDALKQSSPNKVEDTPWKPEAKKVMLSQSGLETKACDAEQCKTMVMPSEDSLMSSAGHQQEQSLSPKENLKSSRNLQSASKASQRLVHKKQSVKQKHPGGTVTKRLSGSLRKKLKKNGKKSSERKPQLQRKISHSVPSEEELESEPVKLDEVFASVLHQELETSVIQNLAKSEKPKKTKNVLQTLEAIGGANCKTPVKALQHVIGSVKNSEKKLLSAKSSGKIPKRSHCRKSEGVCSGPEDNESQMDSDGSSVQESTRENRKIPDVKIKSNKRKHYVQHGLKDSIAALKPTRYESRPVLEPCDKFASRSQSCEQDSISSDNSEELDDQIQHLLSDKLARHKIVMPSNTPNVRRTKRLRLRPLEYWRGERVSYTMRPSGGLMISGIVCPEPEPHRKIKQRKDGHKQRRVEIRDEIPANLDHSLADTSKPTVVVDPVTNEEVLLECVNTECSNACFFKDESVEIYKNLNTFAFATGKLILKPLKEKGHQFVHMDTIAFYIIHGKVLVTLHKTSYYLTTGDFFYVPAGNGYNIRNLLNKESVLLFTQLKKDRPNPHSMLETALPAD